MLRYAMTLDRKDRPSISRTLLNHHGVLGITTPYYQLVTTADGNSTPELFTQMQIRVLCRSPQWDSIRPMTPWITERCVLRSINTGVSLLSGRAVNALFSCTHPWNGNLYTAGTKSGLLQNMPAY